MEIGCLGGVAFEVSSREVKTLNSLSLKSSADYASHKRISGTELLEYTGIDAEQISFSMYISEYLGSDPMEEYEMLRWYTRQGLALPFVLGNRQYGNYLWVITDISLDAKTFSLSGVTSAEVSVTLKEYVRQ